MKVHLHIDRLVLDGIAVERTHAGKVRATVEHELTRLLKSGGFSPQLSTGGAIPRLRGGNIKLRKGASPAGVGAKIARAVHEGMGRKR